MKQSGRLLKGINSDTPPVERRYREVVLANADKQPLLATLEVCFQCNQLEWDGAKNPVPQAFYQGLHPFIERLDTQPEREWQALAR
ncbi:hypothetical protein I5V54_10070 [Stenotrophomonas maltophilia]|nr:hypothetical protein [Stenotrophomonas maltophilia]MBH1844096.1 hypothetical protein [Stenotrophomonas maltophilia]